MLGAVTRSTLAEPSKPGSGVERLQHLDRVAPGMLEVEADALSDCRIGYHTKNRTTA
jgi:hypothetical protein